MVGDDLSAQEVIESVLPNARDRWIVLDRLTRSSRFASSIAEAALSATLWQNGFRMNVGQVEALTFINDSIRILLAATSGDSRLAALPVTGTEYKSIRGPQCAFTGTVAEYRAAKELIDPLHEDYIRSNVTVDWMHRDPARANIRRHVKRLLRKYGYPPDLQDAAVQNVLQQAEALSAEWAA
jgi:Domain of unknown function (DUF3387)